MQKVTNYRNYSNNFAGYKHRDEIGKLWKFFNSMMNELKFRELKLVNSEKNSKKLLEKFCHLSKLKTAFMTDVSHYMRTSLTIIKGEIEIVLQKNRKGEEYRKVFKLLEDESTHLQRIVENLSTLAYADAGALVSRKEIIDLTKICERQIEKVKVLKNRKNISLKAALQKNCYIYGDRNRIAELVFNLLENAIKYTPSHKTIFVELFKKESFIFLRIIDEGIGIEIKDLLKVFKRFYRSEAAKKLCKGTGLGLSICCSIVKSHDGELELSTCPGLGTCIEVRLKLITSFS